MKVQDGEEILHELGPEKNILWIWFFAKALPVGLGGGGAAFGLVFDDQNNLFVVTNHQEVTRYSIKE